MTTHPKASVKYSLMTTHPKPSIKILNMYDMIVLEMENNVRK